MADNRPIMRASYIQDSLKSLDYLGPDRKRRVRAMMPADVLHEIESSMRGTWLPVELDIIITEAASRELGNNGVADWCAEALVRSADGPLIGPFLRTVVALWEPKPRTLYKYVPIIHGNIYKNCGVVTIKHAGPHAERIVFSGLPLQIINSLPYLSSIAGALEGAIRLCRLKGSVVLDQDTVAPQRREFLASWISTKK